MYFGARAVDFIIARFNLFPHQSKQDNVSASFDYLPPDFKLDVHQTTNMVSNCDLEAVCSQAVENADGLTEGVSAIAEVTVGTVADVIEGL